MGSCFSRRSIAVTSSSAGADNMDAAVCDVGELQDGEAKAFEVNESKILLVKEKGEFFAVSNKCTHYNAPLDKGAYKNGIIRCPWHGACFNVCSGDIEDYPGLDSLQKFPTSVRDGKVHVQYDPAQLTQSRRVRPMCAQNKSNAEHVVVVGGGAAASSCVETLRQNNFDGRITMFCAEPHYPYDRPKLSKAPNTDIEKILLRKPEFYEQNCIDVKLNTKVTSIDVKSKTVTIDNGSTTKYDKLMIATGGEPRRLTCEGANLKNVCYLRTPEDGRQIVKMCEGKNVVIIGSSFIGMEVASVIAKKAATVSGVDMLSCPLELVLGRTVGSAMQKLHESNGVKFNLGLGVSSLVDNGSGAVGAVRLEGGGELPADIVIAGIGVVPSTSFLKDSGIDLDSRGFVIVDKNMQTNVSGVWACGDIVRFPLTSHDVASANVQHWQMAFKHGNTAALDMVGRSKPIHSVPFFWTAMFGKNLRYTGYGPGFNDSVIHGSLEDFKFVAYYFKDDVLVSVGTVGRDPVAAQMAQVMLAGRKITKADVEKNQTDDWSKF